MPFFETKKNLKDTCLLFSGRAGIGLGQLVCLRIITGLIEPSQIGLYYYILAIGGILSAILYQPMNFYTTRTFLIWHNTGKSRCNIISIVNELPGLKPVASNLFGRPPLRSGQHSSPSF